MKLTSQARDILQEVWGDSLQVEKWQIDPINKVVAFLLSKKERDSLYLAIVGAHGTGKTAFLAITILLILLILSASGREFKGSLYSGKFDQLKTTLLQELSVWARKSTFSDGLDFLEHRFGLKGEISATRFVSREINRNARLTQTLALLLSMRRRQCRVR